MKKNAPSDNTESKKGDSRKQHDSHLSFKPYYVTHTKIRTLALLDEEQKGSIWYQIRTRLQPIRTASEIQVKIIIQPLQRSYLYQKFAQKATELRLLGMSFNEIAKALNITKKTAINACKHK